MAKIQPGLGNTLPTLAPSDPPEIRGVDRAIVYVRRRWESVLPASGADDHVWKPEPYLRVLRAREELLAGRSVAHLRWNYGAAIKHPDRSAFVSYRKALNTYSDWFVMISLLSGDPQFATPAPQPVGASELPIWFGIIPRQSFHVYGTDAPDGSADAIEQGEQLIEAYGLDWLLDRTMPHGTIVSGDQFIDRVLNFNDRDAHGHRPIGNRSNATETFHRRTMWGIPSSTQTGRGHTFSPNASVWRYVDIADHVLEAREGWPEFTLSGDVRNLRSASEVVQHDGQSVRAILGRVIDRRRGMGACVRMVDAGFPPARTWQPEVFVFSLFAEPFSIGGETMYPNSNQVVVRLDGVSPDEVVIEIDRSNAPEGLVVRGAPLRSMLTLAWDDGSIEEGWSIDDESAYDAAAGSDPVVNDTMRAGLANVYRRFRVPDGWNWRPGGRAALPAFGFDGAIIEPTAPGIAWQHYGAFDRMLFLPEDTTGDAEDMKPMVFLYNETIGGYFLADRPPTAEGGTGAADGTVHASVRMSDRGYGFEVQAATAHLIALGIFDPVTAGASSVDPIVAYTSMFATVCLRTNTCPSVRIDDVLGLAYNNRHGTRLVIDVPDAESWWVTRGTIIGFHADGSLKRANETTLPAPAGGRWTNDGLLYRNDTLRLQRIAALARSWYQSQRAKVRIVKTKLDNQYPLGTMIRRVVDDWRDEEIGTVVCAREWDFEAHRMTIETQYVEPDFAAIVG